MDDGADGGAAGDGDSDTREVCHDRQVDARVPRPGSDTLPPVDLHPYDRPATAGEVLDAGFLLFKRTLPACLPWSLSAVIVGNAPSAYQLLSGQPLALWSQKDPLWWLLMVAAAASSLWVWTFIVLRQLGVMRGEGGSWVADARVALRRLPQSLALIAGAVLASSLGVVLLVVPGAYLWVALWPSLTVLMAEGGGAWASADRALRLVRGNWWHTATVLGVVLSALLALYVFGVLVALALAQSGGGLDRSSSTLVLGIISALSAAVFQPLLTALGIAHYRDLLRRAADGGAGPA